MVRDDFKKFMDQQIVEIMKYKSTKEGKNSNCDSNEYVFEWIKKNAKTFRKNWLKYS